MKGEELISSSLVPVMEQFKVAPGSLQTGHEEAFLYQEGDKPLEQAPREVANAHHTCQC